MRLISLSTCRPGMKLGKTIYNDEGLVLLAEHVELTDKLINLMDRYGIDYIYVDDPRTSDIVIPEVITDETRIRALQELRNLFRDSLEESTRKKFTGSYHFGTTFRNIMSMVIDDLSQHKDAMIMMMNLSASDNYLFQHSLNVCVYASMLGINHGYSREELMTLGLGALLHDIGKTQIPYKILQHPGKLTAEEYEIVKKHTEFGYKLLKDKANIPLVSAHCAFQHHERLNGTGYPRGLKDNEIHEYAQWIGIVDSYDAMTTHRAYRNAMLPHQAIERLFGGANTLYNQAKIEAFRDKIAIYPLGMTVRVNSGAVGVVVDINAHCPHRPVIRILQEADGEELKAPYEIDLSKHLTIMITGVVD